MKDDPKQFVRAHYDRFAAAFRAEDPFSAADIRDAYGDVRVVISTLRENDIIEQVGTESFQRANTTRTRATWKIRDDLDEYITDYLENREALPCGHRVAFITRENGYQCKNCEEIYDRETLEELL